MKKILVIEDNIDIRKNICELLELSGYKVADAENGKEGARKAINWLPDLIICDVMMPVIDGYGALKITQKNPKTNHIPFIFLTAKGDKKDFRKGMNLGADDYITKPFNETELLEAIEIRLSKKQDYTMANATQVFNLEEYYQNALITFLHNRPSTLYSKKALLFKERSLPQQVFFIQKGKVQTYKTNDWGKELVLSLYDKNNFVGISDVLIQHTYQKSAQCIEDSEVTTIAKDDFLDWIQQDINICQYILQLLAKQTGKQSQELLDLAYSSVRQRVAIAILKLRNAFNKDEFDISREELAHFVGATKESTTRMLSEFRKDKIIALSGSSLSILDPVKLEQIKDG